MEQLKDLGFVMKKSILEVRYDRTFLYDEVSNLNRIVKDLKKDFPHSKRNEDGSLALINPQEETFVVIFPESASVISDKKIQCHILLLRQKLQERLIQSFLSLILTGLQG